MDKMNRQNFPKVKNVIRKWTKNGQRYLLHGRDLSGKDIYITIPISESDTEKEYFKKIEEAKRKLNDKKIGSSIYSILDEYFTAKQYSYNTRYNQQFLRHLCFDDRQNAKIVNSILNGSNKPQTKKTRIIQINNFFEWMKETKGINLHNPTLGIAIKSTINKRTRCITDEELDKLFELYTDPECKLIVRLAFFTGARISSIYALTPESIRNGYVFYQNVKCKKKYDYPIPLLDQKTLSLFATVAQKGYLWSRKFNAMKSAINYSMRKAFGRNENGEYLTIHSLRHSFATRAIQNGVPPEIVSKMLDHSSVSTTLSFYAKHSQQQIDDAMDKIFKK
jgi:integrase